MSGDRYVLGLDLDGVVLGYTDSLREIAVRKFGRPAASFPDPTAWSMADAGWVETEADFQELHGDFVRAGQHRHQRLVPGAHASIHRLRAEGIRIRVVTTRLITPGTYAQVVGDTASNLDGHDIPYDDICFVSDKTAITADSYLDDGPHNIAALRAAGRHAITFDTNYNQGIDGERAFGWPDAVGRILAHRDSLLALPA